MSTKMYDIAIIGGGIVGLATAYALRERASSLLIVEAEGKIATQQTGHNSGVIHSGLYYKPGSLKAKNCVTGRDALYRFCEEHGIRHEKCGKLVVAVEEKERPALDELFRRGQENGLQGLQQLEGDELKDIEPHVQGIVGLLVRETGIIDFKEVARILAEQVQYAGGQLQTSARLYGVQPKTDQVILETTDGDFACRQLINCAGLFSDRVARLCGVAPGLQIIPFRGEYFELTDSRSHLVKNLIYPVPDPRFPFLGVHFTRTVDGVIEAGPNAVLAFSRKGYRHRDISLRDLGRMMCYRGFWRMMFRYFRMGAAEMYRSLSKTAFLRSLQRLIPEIELADIRRAGSGVRAQAVAPDGKLVDDFRIVQRNRMIHVLNAPSPGATASLSVGRTIAAKVNGFGK